MTEPPPIIVGIQPVARTQCKDNFWPGFFCGTMAVSAIWMVAFFLYAALIVYPGVGADVEARSRSSTPVTDAPAGIQPPSKEVLDREADAIFAGGKKQWQAATWAGQQYACMIKVMAAHPNDSRSRQRMLARVMWAQIDYAFEDQPLDPSFDETFALIDFMDYQPRRSGPK